MFRTPSSHPFKGAGGLCTRVPPRSYCTRGCSVSPPTRPASHLVHRAARRPVAFPGLIRIRINPVCKKIVTQEQELSSTGCTIVCRNVCNCSTGILPVQKLQARAGRPCYDEIAGNLAHNRLHLVLEGWTGPTQEQGRPYGRPCNLVGCIRRYSRINLWVVVVPSPSNLKT
jgi:hypothetical protein